MATVWIADGYGVYGKDRVADILIDFLAEVKAEGLADEFTKAVADGRVYYDMGTIQVKDTTPVVDVFLDVLKAHGIVPAITD